MKHLLMTSLVAASSIMAAQGADLNSSQPGNPFLAPYSTQFEIPPFEQIQLSHYLPAFQAGIDQARSDIQAIVNNPQAPTFENTIDAMDHSGEILDRVSRVFFALVEAHSSPELIELNETVSALTAAFSDEVMLNDALFSRVKQLYDTKDSHDYTTAQRRAIDDRYKSFVRNGALLSAEDKETLKNLNLELNNLYNLFNKNLLNATNAFAVFVDDPTRLSGIPANTLAAAADEAKARGKEGQWAFTLHAPSRLPILSSADDRQLRHDIYRGYTSLASADPYDNTKVIGKILKARTAKAHLLGFPNYAAYQTDNVMAKTPHAAMDLLLKVWTPTVDRVKEEVAEMQQIVDEENGNFKIEPWDYYYYAEKVRSKKYDFNEAALAPYFAVDSVRKGIFTMAERLYGVKFRPLPDAPKYHPDVKVYEVVDADGNHVAVFMTDYFARPSKRQGAWMDELKSSYIADNGNAVRPIIYNVGNFTKPAGDTPALLTIDEVSTMFHEFGHGLHGMLSRAKYKSQSGTAVDRDFVELPSQIHEHWAMEPELLAAYAHHWQTGETIPTELIEKLQAASAHNAGFNLAERVSAAYLDLKYGLLEADTDSIDIDAFEKAVVDELAMPLEVEYRYHSPYFKHIFGSDHYASGYYTYLWAEVLDTDGFELFKQNGVFDPETARSFKENILEMGGSEDPMVLFVKFRGHQPTPDALLRQYKMK